MRVLDLFAGAGGAGRGYERAGFDVTAVDIEPHPTNPHEFICADALEVLSDVEWCRGFDVIHASPPCQGYTSMRHRHPGVSYPLLVPEVRRLLGVIGRPYVIENVPGSPLVNPVTLCGSMFGLGAVCRDGRYRQLRRHRLFEVSGAWVWGQECAHSGEPLGVYGGGGGPMTRGYGAYVDEGRQAMGIDWMSWGDLTQAIPPAYTEYIGQELAEVVCRGDSRVA